MEHLIYLLVFAVKLLLIVASIVLVLGAFFYLASLSRRPKRGLEVEHLNENFSLTSKMLNEIILSKKEFKQLAKSQKAEKRALDKQEQGRPRVFWLEFEGDVQASRVESLREEISGVLTVAKPGDRVVLRLESAGGVVHGYGLAAAQLLRLKQNKLPLIVSVDKVAASGGYMMACVADHLVAAPFAIVGSIGVVAPVPNFNRLLRKYQIDYKEYTAGDYKRTVSSLAENTPQGVAKFNEQLQETHNLFKAFVGQNRAKLNIDQIATGEHWFGQQALTLGLVDELKTSDTLLLELLKEAEIFKVHSVVKRKLSERLADMMGAFLARLLSHVNKSDLSALRLS